MPFYEYRCNACSHQDTFLESINAPAVKTCPQCGKKRGFKKIVSAAGFQLKGQGWYVTDFRNKPTTDKKPDSKPDDTNKKTETTKTPDKKEGKKNDKPKQK